MKTKITHRPLSDMESDGVYFSEVVKKRIIEDRVRNLCHYSGLPSVWSYSDENPKENEETEINISY
jgi:hypothetical protein